MKKAKQYLALELGQASKRNRAKHKTYMNLNEEEQEVYTKHLERLDKGEMHSRDFQVKTECSYISVYRTKLYHYSNVSVIVIFAMNNSMTFLRTSMLMSLVRKILAIT